MKGGGGKDGIWRLQQQVAMAGSRCLPAVMDDKEDEAVTDEDKLAKGGGVKDGVWQLGQQAVFDAGDGQWEKLKKSNRDDNK